MKTAFGAVLGLGDGEGCAAAVAVDAAVTVVCGDVGVGGVDVNVGPGSAIVAVLALGANGTAVFAGRAPAQEVVSSATRTRASSRLAFVTSARFGG